MNFIRRMKSSKIIYIVLLWLVCVPFQAQDMGLYVSEQPSASRLPVNEVTAIMQDEEGYMWYGTSDGLCRYDGYDIRIVRSDFNTPELIARNYINYIAVDGKGHVWFSTRKGIYVLDKRTFKVKRIDIDDFPEITYAMMQSGQDGHIWISGTSRLYEFDSDLRMARRTDLKAGIAMFYEDSRGNLFFSTFGDGLYVKYSGKHDFTKIIDGFVPTCMTEDKTRKDTYIVCQDGIYTMTLNAGHTPVLSHLPMPKGDDGVDVPFFIHVVQDDHYHYIWLLSYYRGLIVLDSSGKQIKLPENISKHNSHTMSCLYKDHAGRLWISGFNTGCQVICWDEAGISNVNMDAFVKQTHLTPTIMQFVKDEDGTFWIYQDRKGLYLYNPLDGTLSDYEDFTELKPLALYQTLCMTKAYERNSVWVAFYGNRIARLTRDGMKMKLAEFVNLDEHTTTSGEVECMTDDGHGNLWIGTQNGLYRYDRKIRQINLVPESEGEIVSIIASGHEGILFAKRDTGLAHYNGKTTETLFDEIGINSIAESYDGHIWAATADGRVLEFAPKTHNITDRTTDCGMEGNIVNCILVDDSGQVWIVSNQQIRVFNPKTGAERLISAADENMALNRFLPHSIDYDRDKSKVYIGGIPGIIAISSTMPASTSQPSIKITDIHTAGTQSLWFDSLRHQDNFVLYPEDRNIEISFSTLNILHSTTTRFAYRMLGLDDEWISLAPGKNTATYSNLPRGKYTFQVRVMNDNGTWNENICELPIYRRPAWYESNLAYILYLIAIIAVVAYIAWAYQRKMKESNAKKLEEQLVQTKLNYFTNISHELLTPLAVVSSINDSMEPADLAQTQKKRMIQSNLSRLKYLLQQVLDFRKIESGNIQLYVEHANLSQIVESSCRDSFIPLAESRNIQISIEKPFEDIVGYFDVDKIEKVLSNLVSNAIKYSPEGRKVTIRLSVKPHRQGSAIDDAVLSVEDQGIGIANHDINKIFRRFYTSSLRAKEWNRLDKNLGMTGPVESNGIGLSLTKDLIELHHGTINVHSQRGKGSTFTVTFPISRSAYTPNEIRDRKQEEQIGVLKREISQLHTTQHPATDLTLLVVEDNADMLSALDELLSKQYYTYTAANGNEALEVIKAHPEITLVVSDISMPGMDGLTLCNKLKSDVNTSHIIVVILTAMIGSEKQVESYNAGANAYLPKPFESKVLTALLNNLWNQRQASWQAFSRSSVQSTDDLEMNDVDHEFIDKVINVVKQNINSPQLSVDFLASEVCMSRSSLTRKLRAITGGTPLEIIKTIKLKYAYSLLKSHSMSVIEVVEAIGYNDRTTFTKSFKDMFGILPSKV